MVGYVGAASDGQRGQLLDAPELKRLPDGTALFKVSGESAYPVIYDGQFAVISMTRPLRANNLAVVETPDGWLVKRWCPQSDGEHVVLASPDGGKSSIVYHLRDITQRWPVVGVLFE